MNEESENAVRPEVSVWYQRMVDIDVNQWMPLSDFFSATPTKDFHNDQVSVSQWYVQAYAITYFLLRNHSKLQFKSFCAGLREGKTTEQALRSAYHYQRLKDFEQKWLRWLADPGHRRRVALLTDKDLNLDDGVIEKKQRGSSAFKNFSTGWEMNSRQHQPTEFSKSTRP
jgi:hypothetical protein